MGSYHNSPYSDYSKSQQKARGKGDKKGADKGKHKSPKQDDWVKLEEQGQPDPSLGHPNDYYAKGPGSLARQQRSEGGRERSVTPFSDGQ